MGNIESSKFEQFLNDFSETDWLAAINRIKNEIHPVDRAATEIWFRFFPLALFRFLEAAENKDEVVRDFAMLGDYQLADQIDTSHHFLYGHRYWKVVKAAIEAETAVFENGAVSLDEEIRQIAAMVAEKLKVDTSLILGITGAGLMTLNQVGLQKFKEADGTTLKPTGIMAKSPDQIVKERAKDDSQGLLGFLKTVDKTFSVRYSAADIQGKFPIINDEEIASAAARDQSANWRDRDDRCIEGVIPVQCRSAACGTCWIGVTGGEEKLSAVGPRERRQMKVFGYNQPDTEKPLLRLACQAKAFGNVSIVIPPWNGVFGKTVYGNVADVELEPATTSAKANRTIVRDAVKNNLM